MYKYIRFENLKNKLKFEFQMFNIYVEFLLSNRHIYVRTCDDFFAFIANKKQFLFYEN